MREGKATEQKHRGNIPKTEFIAKAKQDYLEHDVCWKLKKVKWSARALIELASAPATTKGGIS